MSGVGLTRTGGRYAVKVSLSEPSDQDLPDAIDGVPLVVEVVGPIRRRPRR